MSQYTEITSRESSVNAITTHIPLYKSVIKICVKNVDRLP